MSLSRASCDPRDDTNRHCCAGYVAVSCLIQISSSDKDAGAGDGAVLGTPRLTNADVRRLLSQAEELQHTSDDAWLAVRFHATTVEEGGPVLQVFLVPH